MRRGATAQAHSQSPCNTPFGRCPCRRQRPVHRALRVCHHLHVHAVAVMVGVVGPAVADPVALREGAVQQDVVGAGLAQDTRQPGARSASRLMTVVVQPWAVPMETPKPAEMRGRVSWRHRYTRATSTRWCGGSLQRRPPSRVTTSIVTHSASPRGRSSAAGQTPQATNSSRSMPSTLTTVSRGPTTTRPSRCSRPGPTVRSDYGRPLWSLLRAWPCTESRSSCWVAADNQIACIVAV